MHSLPKTSVSYYIASSYIHGGPKLNGATHSIACNSKYTDLILAILGILQGYFVLN